jgi:hypothetical protein
MRQSVGAAAAAKRALFLFQKSYRKPRLHTHTHTPTTYNTCVVVLYLSHQIPLPFPDRIWTELLSHAVGGGGAAFAITEVFPP